MIQSPSASIPFVEYVLRALEHPPYMFVSKLAACCTMLFLTRSDPDLLRTLCYKWAVRFQMDRCKLIEILRKRSLQGKGKCYYCRHTSTDKVTELPAGLKQCDTDELVDHFLRILNSLVFSYFSWNWHRTDYVIQVNKEYESFLRENVLPICITTRPEDGEDDCEPCTSLMPMPSYSMNFMSPTVTSKGFFSPSMPHPESYSDGMSSCMGTNEPNGPVGGTTEMMTSLTATTVVHPHSGASTHHYRASSTSGYGLPLGKDLVSPKQGAGDGSMLASVAAAAAFGGGGGGGGGAAAGATGTTAPFSASNTSINIRSSSGHIGTANGMSERGGFPAFQNDFGVSVNSGTGGYGGLVFVTLSNFRDTIERNHNGLVLIFHAKYSAKSHEALTAFQEIQHRQLLNPMPLIAVVYAVTEPELAALYNVNWFPTIVYVPPPSEEGKTTSAEVSYGVMNESHPGLPLPLPSVDHTNLPSIASSFTSRPHNNASVMSATPPQPSSSGARATAAGRANGVNARSVPTPHPAATAADTVPSPKRETTHHQAQQPQPQRQRTSPPTQQPPHDPRAHGLTSPQLSSPPMLTPKGPLLAVSPNGVAGEPSPMELLFGLPENADRNERSDSLTGGQESPPGSCVSSEYPDLVSLTRSDSRRVYPMKGTMTVNALVEWVGSKGATSPTVRPNDYVNRVSALQAEQKYKQFRELHAAVVMLRRLQGGKTSKDAMTVSPSNGNRRAVDAPMFIFLGGGMAAGKTTAAMALAHSPWWKNHKDSSVLVNADEFKVLEPARFDTGNSEVHTRSTRAAESLLVQAINQGRSIVFDGTMMWGPFVKQVIAMVRQAQTTLFKQGAGYSPSKHTEDYFVPMKHRPTPLPMPYQIRFLGITVEPEIAVPRGFLRQFSTGRGVPISTQLLSFKLFAENFPEYAALVDAATLFNNNIFVDLNKGELPPVLAESDASTGGVLRVNDEAAFQLFLRQRTLNENADNVMELYPVSPAVATVPAAPPQTASSSSTPSNPPVATMVHT